MHGSEYVQEKVQFGRDSVQTKKNLNNKILKFQVKIHMSLLLSMVDELPIFSLGRISFLILET